MVSSFTDFIVMIMDNRAVDRMKGFDTFGLNLSTSDGGRYR